MKLPGRSLLILLALLLSAPTNADKAREFDGRGNMSRAEIAALARQRVPGRVLSIRERSNGNTYYEVKVLSGGDVRVLKIQGDERNARPRR